MQRVQVRAYDPQEVLTLYLCGMSITDVAEEVGANRKTIYSFLKASGVEIRQDKGGIGKQETCRRGHTLADAIVKSDGHRECRTCKQARDARFKRNRNAKRKQQGLAGI